MKCPRYQYLTDAFNSLVLLMLTLDTRALP